MSLCHPSFNKYFAFVGASETEVMSHVLQIPGSRRLFGVIMAKVCELEPGKFGFKPDDYQELLGMFDSEWFENDMIPLEGKVLAAVIDGRIPKPPAPSTVEDEDEGEMEDGVESDVESFCLPLDEIPTAQPGEVVDDWFCGIDRVVASHKDLIRFGPPPVPRYDLAINDCQREIIRYRHYRAETVRFEQLYARWNRGTKIERLKCPITGEIFRRPLRCWDEDMDESLIEHAFERRDFQLWRDQDIRLREFMESFENCDYVYELLKEEYLRASLVYLDVMSVPGCKCSRLGPVPKIPSTTAPAPEREPSSQANESGQAIESSQAIEADKSTASDPSSVMTPVQEPPSPPLSYIIKATPCASTVEDFGDDNEVQKPSTKFAGFVRSSSSNSKSSRAYHRLKSKFKSLLSRKAAKT